MATLLERSFAAVLCIALLDCIPALAGEFSVKPIRVDLGPSVKSGAIAVRNEGKQKLSFQVQAMSWSQDAEGKDQYADTQDLVYFPKILSVEAGQEGLIRVGARNTVLQTEKTYRLFIEELPGIATPAQGGSAQVNVLIRFGAPIFVAALKPQDSLSIGSVALAKGVLSFSATNTGNRHQMIEGIELRGADPQGNPVYALTLADRYLLSGTTKSFTTTIAPEVCAQIATLAIALKTDKTSAADKLHVTTAMCP